jgi:nicotinamidase-related amidase
MVVVALISQGCLDGSLTDQKRVLVVVDVQRDYCKDHEDCGVLSETVSPWAASHTGRVVQPIIQHMESGDYDLIVFTRDALNEGDVCAVGGSWINGTCSQGSSLVKGSAGSQVLERLLTSAHSHYTSDKILTYTKRTDDWMTEVATCNPSCWPSENLFDTEHNFEDLTLNNVLGKRGFSPSNTHFYVTGVLTNRCVMKGSLHARQLGFDVTVLRDSVAGPEESDRWETNQTVAEDLGFHVAPEICLGDECNHEWFTQVYLGYKGGPTDERAFLYMQAGGVDFK